MHSSRYHRYMKLPTLLTVVSLTLALSLTAHAQIVASNPESQPMAPGMITASLTTTGDVQLMTLEPGGQFRTLTQQEANQVVDNIMVNMIKVTCNLKIVPARVTASIGLFSLSWTRKDLCGIVQGPKNE